MQVDVIDRHKIRREKQWVCDDSHDAHETRNVKIAATLLAFEIFWVHLPNNLFTIKFLFFSNIFIFFTFAEKY